MKKYLFILLAFGVLLCSCGKKAPQGVRYDGLASEVLTESTKAILEAFELPDDTGMIVRIDSLCQKNDYLDKVDVNGKSFVIHAYLEPRIIKADVYGFAGGELTGDAGDEYLMLQLDYADGESVENAIIEMSRFLLDVHSRADLKYSGWVRKYGANGFKTYIDDLISNVSLLVKPYDNFWGSLMKPFYLMSVKCMELTGSAMSGLLLMILIIATFMLVFLFAAIHLLALGKKGKGIACGFVSTVISFLSILPILIFTLFISMPKYENLVALKEIYGYEDTGRLISAYMTSPFSPSTLGLIIVAMILFIAYKFIDHYRLQLLANNGKEVDEAQREKGEQDVADNVGAELGSMFPVLFCAFIVDKVLVLAFALFYFLKLVRAFILWRSNCGAQWVYKIASKAAIVSAVLGFVGVICVASVSSDTTDDPLAVKERRFAEEIYTSGEIDTMSYIVGMDYVSYLEENKALKTPQIDFDASYFGMSDGLRGRQSAYDGQIAYQAFLRYRSISNAPQDYSVDTVSYYLGKAFAYELKKMHCVKGIGEFSKGKLHEGFDDALQAVPSEVWVNFSNAKAIYASWLSKRDLFIKDTNRLEEECFLQNNSTRPGVQTTSSGLQYIIHDPGTGKKIRSSSTVKVKYTGRNINGEVFDSQTADLKVNKLIRGWKEGLCLLASGGKMTLYIPSDLAYGSSWAGNVEPNSMLIFDLEVVKIVRR